MTTWMRYRWKWLLILLSGALLTVCGYLVYATLNGYTGFPLDDAWIHQVYARNLVERGEWAFNPGQSSGGSTSPLWSVLMAVGHLADINPVIWSGLLGWITLFLGAVLAEEMIRGWIPDYNPIVPWIGFFFVSEWHLVWAAVSGMETSLYVLILLLVFQILGRQKTLYGLAGIIIGLSAWVRPDGITLLGPVVVMAVIQTKNTRERIKRLSLLAGGFLLLFVPYLVFNLHFAGSIWPTTFTAKQAEYAVATGYPLIQRVWTLFLPFLAGGGVILVPGVIAAIVFAWKKQAFHPAVMILWFAGYLAMYSLRLPVNYQHGRYMIPAMACFFLAGLWGWMVWMQAWTEGKWNRLARFFWAACLASVVAVFLVIGGTAFGTDVAIIDTEMVETANWVNINIPAGSRVAAHDIGAMGYFSNHEIIDLAGLVNPDVIPIIRDEAALKDYLVVENAEYLVTFPGWYPNLIKGMEVVFRTTGTFSPRAGGENMTIYHR